MDENNLQRLAVRILSLTYSEMIEVADYLYDQIASYEEYDRDTFAQTLCEWANEKSSETGGAK